MRTLITLLTLLAIGCGPTESIEMAQARRKAEARRAAQPQDESQRARVIARELVKGFLKAPSTATFDDVTSERLPGDLYNVSGFVTSVNQFNAPLKKPFKLRIYLKGKTCNLKGVILDGETLMDE